MLLLVASLLLPSLVVADLTTEREAAFRCMKCLPKVPWPNIAEANCDRLVYNATTTDGNGRWSYDRLVFEGPECGVYSFVIRTKSKLTMRTVDWPITHEEEKQERLATPGEIDCLRKCGGGLLEATCAAPKVIASRGLMTYFPQPENRMPVYRAYSFGCELKTTIVRAYRSEFEIYADLEPSPPSYGELWSIHRGNLLTVPHHDNMMLAMSKKPSQPEEKITDKNVCALKCVGLNDPIGLAIRPECNRTLANETVTAKNGKWSYEREVYEGPECGVHTYLVNSKADLSVTYKDGNLALSDKPDSVSCIRDCGFPICDAPTLIFVITANDQNHDRLFHYVQFNCDGVKTTIVRSFKPDTMIEISLEPTVYNEKWTISNSKLITTTMH